MLRTFLTAAAVAAVLGCGSSPRRTVHAPATDALITFIEVSTHAAYVIDARTRACFLFVDWSSAERTRRSQRFRVAGPVDCAALKSSLPEASSSIAW